MTQSQSSTLDFSINYKSTTFGFYSFYDKKTKKFMPPFYSVTEDEALRQASSIVNFSNSLINKFPEDYDLIYIGSFDEDTGEIYDNENVNIIASCFDLRTEQSVQYDELRKECERQRDQVAVIVSDYHKAYALVEELEKKVKAADSLLTSLKTNNSISNSRKKFLDMLFKH